MIHIAIHSLCSEIDMLEQLLIQLKRNSVHLPKDHGIEVSVCLNTNLVDWDKSMLPSSFFVDKFDDLDTLTASWADVNFFTHGKGINGCNDIRRDVIRTTNKPYVMYLDVDNVFGDHLLSTMYQFCDHMNTVNKHTGEYEYAVLVPQTTRMWDPTWDIITNDQHMDQPASHEFYDVRDPYEAINLTQGSSRNATLVPGFKFAGWGTTISTKLARLIDIPDSLGSYGLDDTFIMHGCQILKDKGYNVTQWALDNEVIIENNLFRTNPYKDYLQVIDRRAEFLAKAHANFNPELDKLKLRI